MTNKTNTAALLRSTTIAAARDGMERDPVPAALADLCAKREGKPVTKRDTDAIAAMFPGLRCRVIREFGWTKIAWCAESTKWDGGRQVANPDGVKLVAMGCPNGYSNERSIIIARVETGATWPNVDAFKTEHAGLFAARDERNAERTATLAAVDVDPTRGNITKAAALVDAIRESMAALDKLAATLPDETRRAIVDVLAEPLKSARTESILWDVAYAARR